MEQAVQLKQISDRLARLEQETAQLRTQVNQLQQEPENHNGQQAHDDPFARYQVDKTPLVEAFERMFESLGIKDVKPIGAENLQKMMAKSRLEPNELSRGIIEMRDE